ncbi:MAG: hypothetical protein FJ146_14535 [Deltaproteobacteria bacterium]|nr:hypothetical protein [Deltaproteobacteria bacterium]
MEFKTVTVTDLKKDANRLFADVSRDKPLRILHRAHDIKVVITLDHYLDLIAYWQSGTKTQPTERTPLGEQLQRVQREFNELNKILDTDADDGGVRLGSKVALP